MVLLNLIQVPLYTHVTDNVICSILGIWTCELWTEISKFPDLSPPNIEQHSEATRCFNNRFFDILLKNRHFPRYVMSQFFFLVQISKIRHFLSWAIFLSTKLRIFKHEIDIPGSLESNKKQPKVCFFPVFAKVKHKALLNLSFYGTRKRNSEAIL